MSEAKKVTKEQFDKFINKYPNQLETSVNFMCEPHFRGYYDFSDGKNSINGIVGFRVLLKIYGKEDEYFLTDNGQRHD